MCSVAEVLNLELPHFTIRAKEDENQPVLGWKITLNLWQVDIQVAWN
jgi:hypothetical protein